MNTSGQSRKTLEITTRIGCRVGCSFCPQKSLARAYAGNAAAMDMGRFGRILLTVPKDVELHFSGFAEPLLNRDAGKMMTNASLLGYKVHLYTTLVGIRLDTVREIGMTQPEVIRIHVPDREAMRVDDTEWITAHELFLEAGVHATYMSMGEQTDRVAAYLQSLGIEVERPDMLSRGGNLWKPRRLDGPIRCNANRWHMNVVLPNGDVYACCMDYGLTMPLGNLLRQTYDEIFEKAEEYASNHNPPGDSICRTCEWAAPM